MVGEFKLKKFDQVFRMPRRREPHQVKIFGVKLHPVGESRSQFRTQRPVKAGVNAFFVVE